MNALLDLLAVAVVVAGAGFWLASRFRAGTPPACHQASEPIDVPPQVLLGASLQRGVDRARARQSEKRVSN